jgi:crotonobetainyl-CoA:carnitine CoA-transferase CaiB-like acyl-CoA transferase
MGPLRRITVIELAGTGPGSFCGMMLPDMGADDAGAHFYDRYAGADGEYVSVGAIEPHFYAELLELSGLGGSPTCPARWTGRSGRP